MDSTTKAKQNASAISLFKKLAHLGGLSEDDFRDKVVRPLYLKKGLRDGRELCGWDEEGKDCIFAEEGKIKRIFHAVQTKRGTLNMSREPKQNVAEAIAQLRLALEVKYPLLAPGRAKVRPDYVILCVSGKVNTAARKHIADELDDDRILVRDANDLIPELDEHYPEYWYGIDADKFPYYNNLKDELTALSDVVLFEDSAGVTSAVSERYVPIQVYRFQREVKREHGKTYSKPKLDKIPVAGVLKNKREFLIAIVGDGGAGKSTALKRLAYQIIDESLAQEKPSLIPVLLRAKDIAQDNARLLDIVGEETKRIARSKTPCFSTDDLAGGKLILLIDALDEVTVEGGRRAVIERIQAFHAEHCRCRVVLTSRNEVFNQEAGLHSQFYKYELSPLSVEQVEQLVTKLVHVRSLPADTARETLRKLKDVHGVTLNPLLVTIFVATSDYNRQDVPANITEVFKKYTEMMLGRWDQTKGFAHQYKYKVKDHLLQKLALSMHRRKLTSLPLGDCRQLIQEELKSIGQERDLNPLFAEISERSCLLRVVGEAVEFRHLLFQEFFAGRGLRNLDEIRPVLHDRWWTKPAVFFCGENPANQPQVASLIAGLDLPDPMDLYTAAIAIGLSTQACYLSKVSDRVQSLKWVVESLGSTMEAVVSENYKIVGSSPILGFALYYLYAKDAVASSLFHEVLPLVSNIDIERFWCLVGLLETGDLETVEDTIRRFKPADERLLFALYLACLSIEGLRLTTSKNKAVATRLRALLEPRARVLASELLKEVDSLVLEIRENKIKALPAATLAVANPSAGARDTPEG